MGWNKGDIREIVAFEIENVKNNGFMTQEEKINKIVELVELSKNNK